MQQVVLMHNFEEETTSKTDRTNRKKPEREPRLRRDPATGNLVPFLPTDTQWYFMYIDSPRVSSRKFQETFRNRFRMSYSSFQTHLRHVSEDKSFHTWAESSPDAVGKPATPLGLLVLGALRYLGRAWTFDDIEESTAISQEVHREFFHVYINWASTTLFKLYVSYPTLAQAKNYSRDYELAGFPGCIGSGDGTHVMM